MSPEILIQEELLELAGIDEMRKKDIWDLLMTFFLVINPDQAHSFELNVNESKKISTGKAFAISAEQQLKGFLFRKELLLFLPNYEKKKVVG